ncbi:glycoside hydrolase family 16 protein [Verrucomicrobiales bacterium]|nr:glycoside hydrolase family 16 protein [Verrucomicrobiales bacterium]
MKDGILRIRAEKRQAEYDGKMREYSSGKMTTTSKLAQRYGRFEIRCKVPKGKGLWPAFWMLSDPPSWPPEIDILEFLGHETDRVYFSNHWPKPNNPDDSESVTKEQKVRGIDFSADFHTFAAEWESGEIRWSQDGVEKYRVTKDIPDVPMFLLVNLAVGGGWSGDPDKSTVFPAYFEIDYVQAWKKE